MGAMNETGSEMEEGLQVVMAMAVNDDDAETWPMAGSHESFVADIYTMGIARTQAA